MAVRNGLRRRQERKGGRRKKLALARLTVLSFVVHLSDEALDDIAGVARDADEHDDEHDGEAEDTAYLKGARLVPELRRVSVTSMTTNGMRSLAF